MKIIAGFILAVGLIFLSADVISSEQGIFDIWQTESSERGYLHVSIDDCGEGFLCGTIVKATNTQGESDPNYEFLGKKMIWDMVESGNDQWSGGKIWDPIKDKTYKSKMSLDKDVLSVNGCIAFFCRSQLWKRVLD